jgi:hypothetical protein
MGVQLSATPADGWSFVKWVDAQGRTLSTEADTIVHITEDTILTAVFAPVSRSGLAVIVVAALGALLLAGRPAARR